MIDLEIYHRRFYHSLRCDEKIQDFGWRRSSTSGRL